MTRVWRKPCPSEDANLAGSHGQLAGMLTSLLEPFWGENGDGGEEGEGLLVLKMANSEGI